MNSVMERFERASGTLRRNGLPLPLPKGLVFRALLRAGWMGADGTLPHQLTIHLVGKSPFHGLFPESRRTGNVAWHRMVRSRRSGSGI